MIASNGRHYRIVQFCNDWISVDDLDRGGPDILNPLDCRLEDEEELRRVMSEENTGFFWNHYELNDDLRFVRMKTDAR